MLDSHEPFKKPLPPMRPQEFPPFYGGYPYHLMQHGSSAFHRPIDATGKPLPVNGKETFIILIEHRIACCTNAIIYAKQFILIKYVYIAPQSVCILIREIVNSLAVLTSSVSNFIVLSWRNSFVCN